MTRCSCIASSSALCVFGVARLISSASTMFAKMGPLRNSKRLPPLASSSMTVVPMMSAGIRSGVNWMRENVERERLGQRAHEHRLAEPGHAFEQRVRPGEHAGEHAVDDLAVADDDLADLFAQRADLPLELLDTSARASRFVSVHRAMSSLLVPVAMPLLARPDQIEVAPDVIVGARRNLVLVNLLLGARAVLGVHLLVGAPL